MSVSQETYPYDDLPQSDNVFRYLVLQPGIGDDPLVCNLQTAPITDTDFEAVSYVWGTPIKDEPIVCEDHVMNITRSLAKVLRRVRLLNKPLKVWADSVCINQKDLEEKGNQVALMGKIYRSANRVLIHIGPDDSGQGPALCSLLNEVDNMIQETCKGIDMSWNSFPYPDKEDPLLIDPHWDALYTLLKQDWFDRGWVVQEAASAPDAQLLWGQSRLDWGTLMRVYVWLSTRASDIYYSKCFGEVPINSHINAYLESHEMFGRAFYSDVSWGSPSILRTLNCAKELDLTDPRDRIYAFMDLPQKSDQRIILHPNYHQTHLKTYHQFAIEYVQSTRTTELLDYVSHNEVSILEDVPSWVPRWDIITWSLTLTSMPSSVAASRTGSTIEPLVTNDGIMRVRGVVIDIFNYVSDAFDWDTVTAKTIFDVWDRVKTAPVGCPYTASDGPECHQLDAFLDSLSAGTYDGEPSEWLQAKASFARGTQSKPIVDDLTSDDPVGGADDDGNDDDSALFFNHIRSRIDKRKFVLTERGYMGLAPAVVQEADLCGIIFGCKTPCVLRRAVQEQHYIYLGATSLKGKEYCDREDGSVNFCNVLGEDDSRDWVDWDVEEQDIYLC
jgi:hypothetical protein